MSEAVKPKGVRGPYDPVGTRKALLKSALHLFEARGFHASSVSAIAQGAGVAKGGFYHHFASKEDLLVEIHDEYIQYFEAVVEEALENARTPADVISALIAAGVANVHYNQPGVAVFIRERRFLRDDRFESVRRHRRRMQRWYSDAIREGVASGLFRSDIDPSVASQAIVGMTALAFQWYDPNGRLTHSEVAETMTRLVLQGLTIEHEP